MNPKVLLLPENATGPHKQVLGGYAVAIVCCGNETVPPELRVAAVVNRLAQSDTEVTERSVTQLWHALNWAGVRPCRVEKIAIDFCYIVAPGVLKIRAVLQNAKSENLDFRNVLV